MSSGGAGCSAGQLVGAVLGTFFSTLGLCAVIGAIAFVCYRRKLRAKYQDSVKKNVISPPSTNGDVATQSYTNHGFRAPAAAYESHATLPIRQSATIDSMTCINVEGTGNGVDGMPTLRQALPGQESLVRLQMSRQDKIGTSFNVKRTDSGRVFVSEILSKATDLLRSIMNPGDEILDVGVTIQPTTTVDAVVNILLAAGASNCPVRLTLLRRRSTQTTTTSSYMSPVHPGVSGTAGLGGLQQSSPTTDDDSPIGFSSFSSEPSPPDEVRLTRWQSAELEVVGQPPAVKMTSTMSGPVPADGQRIGVDQPPNQSRIDADQHRSTSTTVPVPQQSDNDEQIYVNERALAGTSTTAAEASRPSSSSDELYSNSNWARRDDDLEVGTGNAADAEEVGRSLDFTSGSGSGSGDGYSSFDTVADYVNVANYIPSSRPQNPPPPPPPPPAATTSTTSPNVVTVDGVMTSSADDLRVSSADDINESNDDDDEADYINHPNVHLQAAAARRARRDPRDVIKDPDLEGLEKALKAKERASRGGLAYYVDLEEHFTEFPGQKQQLQQPGSRGDDVTGCSSTNASNSDVRSSRNDVTTSD